ncbi:MAG: type II secretion system GspH family protein [Clostridiales bacterium]|jgi:prepilin-type N-terminal cleavage/methylation domain-containing protein|nr:type II secretion system GspH family protein [Clostridiales bacterium]
MRVLWYNWIRRRTPARRRGGGGERRAGGDGGFTLIELIVVLAVMSILLTVLIPPLMDYRTQAAERERGANESAINDAIRQCYAIEGRYPPVSGETGLDYLRDNYGIVIKPESYHYAYAIVDGSPVLRVERAVSK